ncbi:ABC transporter ATP-binding protein/permease [Alphaproteobacteria bacterium]|nr:ABC transporter ATP-binding protein/permease [Alphaproteobacteria bacterium]
MFKHAIHSLNGVWQILSTTHRKFAVFVLLVSIIGIFLETLGIGMIFPILELLSDQNNMNEKYLFITLASITGSPSYERLIIYSILIFLSIYIFKTLYLGILAWVQSKFIFGVKANVTNRLMRQYLNAPYEFHLEQNSGNLIRNITVESNQLVNYVLLPSVVIMSEFCLASVIILLLFMMEPFGSIVVFFTVIFSFLVFQKILGSYSINYGNERQKAEGKLIQKAQEALGGIKDAIILGRVPYFEREFQMHNNRAAEMESKQLLISLLPRYWLELIGVVGLTLLVVTSLLYFNKSEDVMPIIGLFALASFRLLPCANRILNALNALSYADSVLKLFKEELNGKEEPIDFIGSSLPFNKEIILKDVDFQYPNTNCLALSQISLKIVKGECIGIIGKSGAGKSSLAELLLALLFPSSGKITVDGKNINNGLKNWREKIGYVPQNIFITDDTFKKNIGFGLNDEEIEINLLQNAIREAQLEELVSNLPDGINTILGERGVRLSGGQKQRIGIARALYKQPPILIFDEATSSLDNHTELEIVKSIKTLKRTRTIIIIAHRLSTIKHCDRVIEMSGGKIKGS